MAKKTFIVNHPKQYLRVNGKLQAVKLGSEVSMEEKHAESLCKQGKLLAKGKAKQFSAGPSAKAEAEAKPKAA